MRISTKTGSSCEGSEWILLDWQDLHIHDKRDSCLAITRGRSIKYRHGNGTTPMKRGGGGKMGSCYRQTINGGSVLPCGSAPHVERRHELHGAAKWCERLIR